MSTSLAPHRATATRPRQVVIVLFPGVQSLDVTGPMEVFAGASRAVPGSYALVTATIDGEPVLSSSGLLLTPDRRLDEVVRGGTVVVPGGDGTRGAPETLVRWLRESWSAWDRTVSVCTGAFLLARAGLLDGRRVTTHWAFADRLAASFPAVDVDPDPIFVRDGTVVTSAGVTAGIDAALALVEDDLGRDVALTIARHLVVFLRRPGNQRQFSAPLQAQMAERDGLREVQRFVAEQPGADLSVAALAARAGLSPRHFARLFHEQTGVTPGRYVHRVRLETARRLLEDTDDGIERVAAVCGYGTSEAMRRAFLATVGVPPAEYRRRATPLAATS